MLFLHKLDERQLGTTQGFLPLNKGIEGFWATAVPFPTLKNLAFQIYQFTIRASVLSLHPDFSTRFACGGFAAKLLFSLLKGIIILSIICVKTNLYSLQLILVLL